ncbi:CDP-glycerol glycerophosphotransferase family protein [Staphylococcus epidermidis]|nr:CDP-glycerol glycerophosphotransferase family protein [Staphylococcus epidermidis]MCT2127184.1 CDP-glycerol glycerophosphotransferase family protein [Staphylococcus epidermidis]
MKKFILRNIYSNDDYTDIEIYLDHFHFFNSKLLKIRINHKNISFETVRKTANIIILRVENKNLLDNRLIDLEFIYNRKKLWLTYSKNLTNTIILNGYIFSLEKFNHILRLNKYENHLKAYNHSIQSKNIVKEEDQLLFNTEYNIDSFILLNAKTHIDIPVSHNKLSLSKLNKLSPEKTYSIFVAIKEHLYPLEIANTQIFTYLTTQQEWKGNQLKITFKKLNVQNLIIRTLLNDSNIKISFEINENGFDHYHLSYLCLVEHDLTYFSPKKLETIANENKIITKINLNDFNNIKKKKLAIVFEDKLNGEQIFYILNTKDKVSFKGSFTFDNKLYNLNIKKQKGITLLTSKPKIKPVINFITDDLISCHLTYANIHEVFSTYITFEDRESQNKYELPVYKGEQSIEIPYDELEKLSTSSKNIIDIFLSTYDGKTLLQKEKIRYTDGIYKKDNYLSFKCFEKENQKSYYMITLTPFKNLKIENFNLTNDEFQILENGKKSNDIWLIGERRDTAQDNGITFFKWLQNHTHIDAYYVIDPYSNDFKKIKHLPNVLSFASKEHFEVVSKANVLISTHDLENIVPYKTAARFWGYEDTIKVFLQHGVLGRKKVEYDKKYYDFPFNLFNVSSTYEKKEVVMKQLGYHDDEVAVTGLPRFDHLPQKNTNEIKKILIMPTWRDLCL